LAFLGTTRIITTRIVYILKKGTNWTFLETKITYLSPNGAILIQPGAAPQEIQAKLKGKKVIQSANA
jgi:hypothetical protein